MSKTHDNPLGLSKADAGKLQARADRIARLEHDESLRKRGLAPTVADVESDISPSTAAGKALAARGIQAVRLTRASLIAGERYEAGEVLLPWPTKPLPGFVEEKNLSAFDAGMDYRRDGEQVEILTECRIAGRLRKIGELLDLWPAAPLRGFLPARNLLDLVRDGIGAPVELEGGSK